MGNIKSRFAKKQEAIKLRTLRQKPNTNRKPKKGDSFPSLAPALVMQVELTCSANNLVETQEEEHAEADRSTPDADAIHHISSVEEILKVPKTPIELLKEFLDEEYKGCTTPVAGESVSTHVSKHLLPILHTHAPRPPSDGSTRNTPIKTLIEEDLTVMATVNPRGPPRGHPMVLEKDTKLPKDWFPTSFDGLQECSNSSVHSERCMSPRDLPKIDAYNDKLKRPRKASPLPSIALSISAVMAVSRTLCTLPQLAQWTSGSELEQWSSDREADKRRNFNSSTDL